MALVECKACGKEISENAKECPHCGEPLSKKVEQETNWSFIIIVILVVLVIGAISSITKQNTVPQTSIDAASFNMQPYKILQDEKTKDIKRVVKVMLKERVSNETLKSIAQKIKQIDPLSYHRTFIGYFLPESNKDFGYWATTNFDPYLKVKIYGTTLKGKKLLTKKPEVNPDRKIIGTWVLNTAFGLTRMTFFIDKDNKLFLEQIFDDGSKKLSNLSEINNSDMGRKLVDGDKYKNYGEYYLLMPSGRLEHWDKKGLLRAANK